MTPEEMEQLRQLAAQGDHQAQLACARWQRWQDSKDPNHRRHLRRAFLRTAHRALGSNPSVGQTNGPT